LAIIYARFWYISYILDDMEEYKFQMSLFYFFNLLVYLAVFFYAQFGKNHAIRFFSNCL
jgi:hypothetical protein